MNEIIGFKFIVDGKSVWIGIDEFMKLPEEHPLRQYVKERIGNE